MSYTFSGQLLTFGVGNKQRKFIVGAMRYGNLINCADTFIYDSSTGEGEQRHVIERHARKIKREMTDGKYAPTCIILGTRASHRDQVQINDGIVKLEVDDTNKLPILDGGNRKWALEELRKESNALNVTVSNLYIPYILYLDGNTKEDFLVLQAGKPVSRDHTLSLSIAAGHMNDKHAPYYSIARKTAVALHTTQDSFLHNLVQFDSSSKTKLPISLSSVSAKGASELAFSLYGGGKIAIAAEKDSIWLSNCILTAYRAIVDGAPNLLNKGSLLCPIPAGTKAGTSMMIALGNMLAARTWLRQLDEPDQTDWELLVECAEATLDEDVSGNSSADRKRKLFNKFCVNFFDDLNNSDEVDDEEFDPSIIGFHEGIPVALIKLLSPSTFSVSKLPTEKKSRGRKKAVVSAAITNDGIDDVDLEVDTKPFSIRPDDFDAEESAPWDEDKQF